MVMERPLVFSLFRQWIWSWIRLHKDRFSLCFTIVQDNSLPIKKKGMCESVLLMRSNNSQHSKPLSDIINMVVKQKGILSLLLGICLITYLIRQNQSDFYLFVGFGFH